VSRYAHPQAGRILRLDMAGGVDYVISMKLMAVIFGAALSLSAQTNPIAATSAAAAVAPGGTAAPAQHAEQIRTECVAGRRLICGKILKILPDGLVVDSGYTNLAHPPLNTSWLVPGRVSSGRPANLVEGRAPESVCVGPVFLTNLPRARGPAPKPKLYDYVVLLAYPAGRHTYESVGGVKKTVRRFSADLIKAVELNLAEETPGAPSK
jgi:hypothetical protein